ncbi:CAP domain-containing protein [Flavobacterium sp. J27]|uniref:CAP domain-containing protein n=1 Tax=Flavobacterium sp. J27 TaxID=2060419 RepID=UPI00102F3BBC|nr:CAP domain-containing protein [Flavobacterium sp. J27]
MKNTLFLFLFFFNSLVVVSQELHLDDSALETEILQLINQHRKTFKLNALEKDPVLLKAAQDQSNYMLQIKKLSHEQATTQKKYPKNRIKFHGGIDFFAYGENVLYLTVEPKEYTKEEIATLAQKIYKQWEESPPHYQNMTSKDFGFASLAFAFDTKAKRLYATTVFGNK